ncbi:MAG: ThiF family adenylyltransferase [Planctomycetota bacterium]
MSPSRYSRQERLAGIGEQGQRAICRSTVLIVGLGALGTHSATSLARAGVGRLLLCDRDIVDLGNLQRQVLFTEADARDGTPKAVAAARALAAANSTIAIEPLVAHCSRAFLDELPARPDLVLDGTDNFATRYLLNDWSRRHGVPWIYAGAVGGEGAAMVVRPDGPCLRCLWPEAPAAHDVGTCETVGVLEPAIAAVTAFQTAEALKLLSGNASAATRGVFTCDVWRGSYAVLGAATPPSPDCPVCTGRDHPALAAAPPQAAVLCGRDAVQIDLPHRAALDLDALARRLDGVVGDLERTRHYLRFAADGVSVRVFPGGRALLFGVQDPLRARALYDRWIGTS